MPSNEADGGQKSPITNTRIKREQTYTKRVMSTWEPTLSFNADLRNIWSNNWLTNSEVLVGRRMLRPCPRGVPKLAFFLTPVH